MKKMFCHYLLGWTIALCLSCLLFTACGGSDDEAQPTVKYSLSATIHTLEIEAKGGTTSITVITNEPWTVTSNQTWCTVSPTTVNNQAKVIVKAEANTDAFRTATISIVGSNSGTVEEVKVLQDAQSVIGRDEYVKDKEIK